MYIFLVLLSHRFNKDSKKEDHTRAQLTGGYLKACLSHIDLELEIWCT